MSSLRVQKFRELHKQTLAEGVRLVRELFLTGYPYEEIFATERWSEQHPDLWRAASHGVTLCSEKELERMSALKSPQGVLAVVPIQDERPALGHCDITVYCDRISDPGNMGTILRLADWFGIGQVITGPGSVSLHNPKVIQASMGSYFRVHHTVLSLSDLLTVLPATVRVCGAVTNGAPLNLTPVQPKPIVIVIGNEASGIAPENEERCTELVTIPGREALPGETAESLNAAMAAAIMCYHFAVEPAESR